MRPADYPIRWERAFGWGEWHSFWRLMFPRPKIMHGCDVLLGVRAPLWKWPFYKWKRLMWAIRGPL